MKSLICFTAIVACISLSSNAFATMEASWDEEALSTASNKTTSCPTYIFVKDTNNQLSQKVWAHEIVQHKGSVVDSGECVYQ